MITDYVNPQLRKAQLRGNVNVVPVYACANTHNGACPDASINGARDVNLVVWPIMPRLHFPDVSYIEKRRLTTFEESAVAAETSFARL